VIPTSPSRKRGVFSYSLAMKTVTFASLAFAALATAASAETYHLYFMGGQSNMVGFGSVADLDDTMRGAVPGAVLYLAQPHADHTPADGDGAWTPLAPGMGNGAAASDGGVRPADRFGPELTFARRLRELRPGEPIAIIKYARNGSSLDVRARGQWGAWDPHDREPAPQGAHEGVNQYDHALAAIARATASRDIDGDGEDDTLIPAGIVWMQGETDATNPETAGAYAENLAELAELLRAALRADGLPFVIGRISDRGVFEGRDDRTWAFGDTVRAAQASVAEADPDAALVTSTDGYAYSDPWHYDSAGYLDLGARFAEAMDELRKAD
jgi:hypothetical protein